MPHAATQMARTTAYVKEASSGTVSLVQVLAKTRERNTGFRFTLLGGLEKQ